MSRREMQLRKFEDVFNLTHSSASLRNGGMMKKYGKPILTFRHHDHSYLSDSTGFASAALIACVLTVSSAMMKVDAPTNTNVSQLIEMR
jgi:hypothetical protein